VGVGSSGATPNGTFILVIYIPDFETNTHYWIFQSKTCVGNGIGNYVSPKTSWAFMAKNQMTGKKEEKKIRQLTSWKTQCCYVVKRLKTGDFYDYIQNEARVRAGNIRLYHVY
jgi:hypothetical protein